MPSNMKPSFMTLAERQLAIEAIGTALETRTWGKYQRAMLQSIKKRFERQLQQQTVNRASGFQPRQNSAAPKRKQPTTIDGEYHEVANLDDAHPEPPWEDIPGFPEQRPGEDCASGDCTSGTGSRALTKRT